MARLRKALSWIGLAIAIGGVLVVRPALRTGAGTAAHNLCSSIFVSQLPEESIRTELVDSLIGPASHLLSVRVDRARGSVDATLLFAHATAQFSPGYGCRLVFPAEKEVPLSPPPAAAEPAIADGFAPDTPVQAANPAIAAALDQEFNEIPGQAPRRVKAVVIVHDGHVVAERYAPGYDIDTPVMSFSVAKSITNALLGILVGQGKLNMNTPAAVPEWSLPTDPRHRITPNDLLRMASGLDARESDTGFDTVSRMFYDRNDMGGYSASLPAAKPPQSAWEYSSNDTLILDRIMAGLVDGGPAGFRRFADDELFKPIGMNKVTLEFDGVGTFVGASHVYAPARAFARFGLLYLNDGVAPEGRRILPEGWVDYSRRSTLGSTYGAGFWTNDGTSAWAASRISLGFPKDGFFATGNLGQRIYIIPSARLVIARFGYSRPPDFGIESDLALIAAVIAALKEP